MARVQLNVWVTEEEREQIKLRAVQAGISVGRLVAEAVIGAPLRDPVRDESARARADEALERVVGVESSQESFERRLSRLEEMAGL